MANPETVSASTVTCPTCRQKSPLGGNYETWSCPYCREEKASRPKANKYGAQKVTDDGYTFDSKAEWMRYRQLKLMVAAGQIHSLKVHPFWIIEHNGIRICRYTADFEYFKDGFPVVEDVKSRPTREKLDYVRVKKMMKAFHGIDIQEVLNRRGAGKGER